MARNSMAIKTIAWVMVICIAQVFVTGKPNKAVAKSEAAAMPAIAAAPLGRLVADGPVTINGVKARTGDTVFPGAQIQTVAGIGATVQIGTLGQIDISPDTTLLLNYDRGSILTEINTGCAVLAANDGVQGILTMPGGITKKNDVMKNSPLSACSDITAAGAKSVKVGGVSTSAVTLGGGSVGFAEFGSMMLSSTGLVTGYGAFGQSEAAPAAAAAVNGCCCCCCCCDPSASAPCRK
jgi:hypothetical protein